MLGRSKPPRNTRGVAPSNSFSTISSRVSASAVAVKAASGTPKRPPEVADPEVVGAEVVAPLAHAVGLVHRDHRDARALEHPLRAARGQPLGREVRGA